MAQEGWKVGGWLKGTGIPAPSGKYTVGCVDLMLDLAEDQKKGGLLVRLHYPTDASPDNGYSYGLWSTDRAYSKGFLDFSKFRFSGVLSLVLWSLTESKVPALVKAPLLKVDPSNSSSSTFPVIIFSHGLGAMRTTYSSIVCDLASHGYVVASVEHRDESACAALQRIPKAGGQEGELEDTWIPFHHLQESEDEFGLRNKQVRQRADEVSKSLDILNLLNQGGNVKNMLGGSYDYSQFKGRLDVSTAAVIGHSFGGATAIQTLFKDERFMCGLALDCWMLPLYKEVTDAVGGVLPRPLYFINSYDFQWKENVQKMMSLCRPPDSYGRTAHRVITLDQTNHISQTDTLFVMPGLRMLHWFGFEGSKIDSVVAHQVNMDVCHAFLKRHLLKDSEAVPDLDDLDGHSEYVIFGTNLNLTSKNSPEENGVQNGED